MLDIIADPPAPTSYPPDSGLGIAQSQSLDPDLSALARGARARRQRPFGDPSGLTQSDVARLLQIRCKFAAPKTKKPRICATNREIYWKFPADSANRRSQARVSAAFVPPQSGASSKSSKAPNLRRVNAAFC